MNTLSYKTISANAKTVDKQWVLVDADSVPLGRVASVVAQYIRGKHKTNYTPHVDCGDNVIVINAEKVSLSGNKWKQKQYIRHTGYPGGLKEVNFEKLQAHKPEMIIEKAVKGMLPKGPLGRAMFRKLKVYAGNEHTHAAQKPQVLDI